MILTKELVIATDQCTEYQFKSPFFPGGSCEDIYNKNPESHDWPGYYWIFGDSINGPSDVYCGMNYTGSSCEDIYTAIVQKLVISQDIIVSMIASGHTVTC